MADTPADGSRHDSDLQGAWQIGVGATQPSAGLGVQRSAMDDFECPFVDRYDARCSEHLTMGGLGYAYRHCFAEFGACPVHAELMAEEQEGGDVGRRRVELTVNRSKLVPVVQAA